MTERLQLNVRMDGQRDLYEALRDAAQRQGLSINQFVLGAIRAAVGMEAPQANDATKALAADLALVKERLAQVEAELGESVA